MHTHTHISVCVSMYICKHMSCIYSIYIYTHTLSRVLIYVCSICMTPHAQERPDPSTEDLTKDETEEYEGFLVEAVPPHGEGLGSLSKTLVPSTPLLTPIKFR